jgi:hypothetical protein
MKNTKAKSIITHPNGAVARLHNKRISVVEMMIEGEKGIRIQFDFVDTEAHMPAARHNCIKNKIRQTTINLSEASMEALVLSYVRYRESKNKQL